MRDGKSALQKPKHTSCIAAWITLPTNDVKKLFSYAICLQNTNFHSINSDQAIHQKPETHYRLRSRNPEESYRGHLLSYIMHHDSTHLVLVPPLLLAPRLSPPVPLHRGWRRQDLSGPQVPPDPHYRIREHLCHPWTGRHARCRE